MSIKDAGDGVRAVMGRRAVAQHLDLAQRDGRNGGDVGALRPEGDAVAAVPGSSIAGRDDGRGVADGPGC